MRCSLADSGMSFNMTNSSVGDEIKSAVELPLKFMISVSLSNQSKLKLVVDAALVVPEGHQDQMTPILVVDNPPIACQTTSYIHLPH